MFQEMMQKYDNHHTHLVGEREQMIERVKQLEAELLKLEGGHQALVKAQQLWESQNEPVEE